MSLSRRRDLPPPAFGELCVEPSSASNGYSSAMNVLYLTSNRNLGSTARILQSWLHRGSKIGVRGIIALPRSDRSPIGSKPTTFPTA